MTVLLAIDDDAGRYDGLRRYLGDRSDVQVVVACCAACVAQHLPTASAVLLDYDLDSGELCEACGGWPEQVKSTSYLPAVLARRVPTVVTSCSYPANVLGLCRALHQGGVPHIASNAHETDCELRWLGWLWLRGVL